jgi:hypothetical protein
MMNDDFNDGNPFGGPAQSVDFNESDNRYTMNFPKFSPPPVPSAPPRPQTMGKNQFSWNRTWQEVGDTIFNLNSPYKITVSTPEVANAGSMMSK